MIYCQANYVAPEMVRRVICVFFAENLLRDAFGPHNKAKHMRASAVHTVITGTGISPADIEVITV